MAIENQPIPASGRVKVMSVDFDDESATFNIGFTNGKSYEFGINQVTDDIKHKAMLHGFEQKLRDAAAGVKGNADEAYELVTGVGNRLLAGEWSKTREGGSGGTSAYWIEAVMRLKVAAGDNTWSDKTTATTRLSGLPDEKRDALKKHPQVVAMVAQIKAERAAAELERARAGATDGGSMEDLFSI